MKDGAEMVLVPAGEFMYGENKEKRELDAFYMDKYPVTNERYRKFVRATGHRVPYLDQKEASPFCWKGKDFPKGKAKYPVVLVDWHDAAAFCAWAGKTLPSEEQWEKAARGTDGRSFPWGDEFDENKCNCWLTGIRDVTPVDKFPQGASPYGCQDMSGNVWEWTNSPRRLGYEVRGGSYFEGDVRVRCYVSDDFRPWPRAEVKGRNCGFRCCYVPPK
jgi:formylglycine-generating enzyme required for sulfatase activity